MIVDCDADEYTATLESKLTYPMVDGCLHYEEVEESRAERIEAGNKMLAGESRGTIPGDHRVLPVAANGECFLKSLAVELQCPPVVADSRSLYALALEALISQKESIEHIVGETDAIREQRRTHLGQIAAYDDEVLFDHYRVDALDSFDLYALDKLEAIFEKTNGLRDRHWCDTPEILALLYATNCSMYISAATQGCEDFVFWNDERLPAGNFTGTPEACDFWLVHWTEDTFAHYDPVYSATTHLAHQTSEAMQKRFQEKLRRSEMCKAYARKDIDKAREVALEGLFGHLKYVMPPPPNGTPADQPEEQYDIMKQYTDTDEAQHDITKQYTDTDEALEKIARRARKEIGGCDYDITKQYTDTDEDRKARKRARFLRAGTDDEHIDNDLFNKGDGDSDTTSDETSEDKGEDAMSEDDDIAAFLDIGVEPDKTWTTLEDRNLMRVEALSRKLRDRPLLPPHPDDARRPWLDTKSAVAFPACHCAVKGCPWTSDSTPCVAASCTDALWYTQAGLWCEVPPRQEMNMEIFACCDDSRCLRQHLLEEHLELLDECCGRGAVERDAYDFYLEAIAMREQETMPSVGCSIDRRTFRQVKEDLQEKDVQALICTLCACIATTCNGLRRPPPRVPVKG